MIVQGIGTSIALETLYFCDFSTGGGGGGGVQIPCLRWRSSIVKNVFDCRLSGVGGYTQFGRCIYDRQIGGQFKTSVSRNYGFN